MPKGALRGAARRPGGRITKEALPLSRRASRMGGRRPTFPRVVAVSSALPGLTSLFGMGRGAPRRHSRHVSLFGTLADEGKHTTHKSEATSSRPLTAGPALPRASFRAISAARLNVSQRFHLRPIDVVVCHGPLRRPHLGEGFALRCFQRLSRPDAATRRCGWRRNRCTVGPSDPVLSY